MHLPDAVYKVLGRRLGAWGEPSIWSLSSAFTINLSRDPGQSFVGLLFPLVKQGGQDWVIFKVL